MGNEGKVAKREEPRGKGREASHSHHRNAYMEVIKLIPLTFQTPNLVFEGAHCARLWANYSDTGRCQGCQINHLRVSIESITQ